jgi:hypothetical protein
MMTPLLREGEGRAIVGIRRTPGPEGDRGRREVSVTAVGLVEVGGVHNGPVRGDESFIDPLVAQLSAQHGLDPRAVRSLAVHVLASFAGARVRAFVPILVEKRLRETCRGLSGLGTIKAAYLEPTAAAG